MSLEGLKKGSHDCDSSNSEKDNLVKNQEKAITIKTKTNEDQSNEASNEPSNGENVSGKDGDKTGAMEGKEDDSAKDSTTEERKSRKGRPKKKDALASESEEKKARKPTRTSKRNVKSDDDKEDDDDDDTCKQPQKKPKTGSSKSGCFVCERNTPDGRPTNLKISAWNIAGLRAWVKKDGSLDYVLHQEQPDMMVLVETKCADNKLPPEVKIPDYTMYTVTSEKEGYCGVLLYTKIKPISVQYGIGNKDLDSEGRCIIAEFKDFYLVCAYVPNAGQGLKTLPKKLKWNIDFLKLLKSLDEKKPVVLCGDLNVAHEPIDLANPKTNTKNAGFTKEERDDFTKLLNEGFVDSFRHLYPNQNGAYTFWTNRGGARSRNVGWRLDYFVLSKRFLPNLCDSIIRSEVMGSDHCPITLCLNV